MVVKVKAIRTLINEDTSVQAFPKHKQEDLESHYQYSIFHSYGISSPISLKL